MLLAPTEYGPPKPSAVLQITQTEQEAGDVGDLAREAEQQGQRQHRLGDPRRPTNSPTFARDQADPHLVNHHADHAGWPVCAALCR
ncbi:hypothetical protein [Rhodanobacter lindaniclasticus]